MKATHQMARRKKEESSAPQLAWHCVLDGDHRLIYLGQDEAKANAALIPGAILRSALRMGDAQSAAAIAISEQARSPE